MSVVIPDKITTNSLGILLGLGSLYCRGVEIDSSDCALHLYSAGVHYWTLGLELPLIHASFCRNFDFPKVKRRIQRHDRSRSTKLADGSPVSHGFSQYFVMFCCILFGCFSGSLFSYYLV